MRNLRVKLQSPEQAKAMEGQKALLAQLFAQIVIDYKSDGQVELIVPNAPTQEGTWELTENDQKLTVVLAGQSDYETIQKITEKELKTTTSKGEAYVYIAQ